MNKSVVLWQGPSQLTGDPVVVIASGLGRPSVNPKTGRMVQVYILGAELNPIAALSDGLDKAACGACPHRSVASGGFGSCYVQVANGPLSLWRSWQRGNVPMGGPDDLAGRSVRLGAYGDPAAVPVFVWRALLAQVTEWTGYTHAWRSCDPRLQRILMASVDSPSDLSEASGMGWRTFRSMLPSETTTPGEIDCPGERGVQCIDCGLCSGSRGPQDKRRSIAIVAHGSASKVRAYERMRALQVIQ